MKPLKLVSTNEEESSPTRKSAYPNTSNAKKCISEYHKINIVSFSRSFSRLQQNYILKNQKLKGG
jgi:hypothetical protein